MYLIFDAFVGGESVAKNIQIMQTTVNRKKSDKIVDEKTLKGYSRVHKVTDELLDVVEMGYYGNINRYNEDTKSIETVIAAKRRDPKGC